MFRKLFLIIPAIFLFLNLNAQLPGGTYTIGSGGNYTSFATAISAMSSGISGPVVFSVKDGTYTENLTINAISGASASNTITFQSQSGDSSKVILTSSGSATLKLNGAGYITFRKLTLKTTNYRVIDFYGGASQNKFLNCQLLGYSINSQVWTYAVVYSQPQSGITNNYNEFRNNLIKNGSRGIHIESYTNGPYSAGLKIANNTISDFATYGIYLSNEDAPEITGNTISTTVDAGHWNMYLNYCPNSTKVKYNKIYFTIGYGYGIFFNQCHALSSAPSEVYNNFIFVQNTSSSGGNAVGIELNYNQYTRVYHNNFLSLASPPATNIKGCMYIDGAGPSSPSTQGHYDIRNNNFVNNGGEYTISVYTLGSIDAINNNNYYCSGTKFGRIQSTEYATFAAFTSALGDANAKNIDPQYKTNYDQHIQNSLLKSTGENLTAYVSDDIDHDSRPIPPTIGADEPGLILPPTPTAPATISAVIGSPANGLSHHLTVSWSTVNGVDGYSLEYSNDGSSWNSIGTFSPSTVNSYDYDAGDRPNVPYYFRIQSYSGASFSAYTSMNTPRYTACDYPSITVTNPTASTLDITLQNETPVVNPSISTFSLYCPTLNSYVQATGNFGSTEVFQTKAQWGTVTVKGLTNLTQYCFYAKARNQDGDIRYLAGATTTLMTVQPFNSDVFCHTSSGCPSTTWYAPNYNTPIDYVASGGNPGGMAGFAGSWNNYWGNFIRLPQQNCTGQTKVVLTFDMKSSYFASHPNDGIRFYLWDNGSSSYKNTVTSIKIDGIESIVNLGANGYGFYFTKALNWAKIEVTFDLSTVINKTNVLFYLEPSCYYNDSQPYYVYFDNIYLTTEAAAVTVCGTTSNACTPPTANIVQGNQAICEGGNLTFTLNVSGSTPFSYQWKKDSGDLSSATGSTFSINPVMASGAGNYSCNVKNSCGSINTSLVNLTVNTLPVITKITSNQSRCSGDTVTMKISAASLPSPVYQWKKDGQTINGATSTRLSLTSLSDTDSGNYTCIVSNTCGSVSSNSVSLSITLKPHITFITPTKTKCTRDSVLFKVISEGSLLSYQWYKNNKILNGATHSSYSMSTLLQDNAGKFKCIVTNSCGLDSAITYLIMLNSPIINNTIDNRDICEGNNVVFTIEASGTNLSYQWSKGGNIISGATNTVYSINDLKQSDGNIYTCTVSNYCGNSKLPNFILNVMTKPAVNTQPISTVKNAGESITYSLSPSGTGPFLYQWQKDTKDITGATTAVLKLDNLNTEDSGSYGCVITNSCGSITANVGSLTVICSNCNTSVSGYVIYDNSKLTPMSSTTVYLETLEGFKIDSALTDLTGAYIFNNVANGSYMLTCRTDLSWSSANPTDALVILKYFVKLYSITDPLRLLAGDVNNDGTLNSTDALIINKRFVSLLSSYKISDWLFEKPIINVAGTNITQDIKAICAGDVNISYPSKFGVGQDLIDMEVAK